MFLGLTVQAWITIVVILVMFTVLMKTNLPPSVVFFSAVVVLFVTGAIDASTAVSGFSSSAVVTVGALFLVVGGLYNSGVLKWVVKYLLGKPKSYALAILKLMIPAGVMSAFVTDSTVTALFIKAVKMWAKKLGTPASKFLIPLSYASLVGGTLTLLGTAPNLIVSGLYAEKTGDSMNIFTVTPLSLICFVVLIISVLVMSRWLPERKSPDENFEKVNDYTAELLVPADNKNIGKTIKEAKLDNIEGGHLIEIIRFDKEVISPVTDDEFILGGDRLVFSGDIDHIADLKKSHGLAIANHHLFSLSEENSNRKVKTATVKFGSKLTGKTFAESGIEDENGVVLIAISREGERISTSPREVVLQPGDTLLLEYSSQNKDALEGLKGDLIVAVDEEEVIKIDKKTLISSLILLAMILLSSLGVTSVLMSCMAAAVAMMVFGCLTPKKAQKSVDWGILMIYACSIVFGKAVQMNGIADAVANLIVNVSGSNVLIMMFLIAAAALFLTEIISNTATASIFFPIVYQSAVTLGVDPKPLCIMLMLCVSMSFATPLGSPSNTLVYGPGGYKFSDFLRIGIPMNFIMLFTIVLSVYFIYLA